MTYWRSLLVSLSVAGLVLSCTPPAGPPGSPSGAGAPAPADKKRLVASLFADPSGIYQELTQTTIGSVPGLTELHQLVHAGLSYVDDQEVYQPHLAEALPTVENGLWKVLPDGRMETTWRLKPNIRWHDGTLFTAEDLAFTMRFHRDREIGIANLASLDLVEGVDTPDPRTVVVRWSAPFIEADSLFSPGFAMPVARHVLEGPLSEDKAGVLSLRYWREEYIGTGAYRVQDWVPGSQVTLTANDQYVMGRPRIDQIEVRFITEFNTVVANLLAGAVEKHLGRGFGVEQILNLRDTAPDLNILVGGGLLGDAIPVFPQFINTDPPIVTSLEFRRALLMAIDRQEMTDTINYGLGPIAHTWLQPDRREYRVVEGRIVRYEYEARRSSQLIEALGYTKGPDGVFRAASGSPLRLELRTTDQRLIQPRSAFSVTDYWKRLGLEVTTNNVPNQLIPDREYRATFPAFELVAGGITARSTSVMRWHSSQAMLPENRFSGGNRARYRNPEYDSFIERYVSTVPMPERLAALGDVIHHQTENLTIMTLFYEGSVILLGSKRLKNVTSNRVWNAHLWDLGVRFSWGFSARLVFR